MKSADEQSFVITVMEKQKVEGKKRPQMVEVDKTFKYDEVKWVKNIIDFKWVKIAAPIPLPNRLN